jgi:hypothetical protein
VIDMKNADKFLIGIVIGVLLLVVTAWIILANRPAPAYQAENTPTAVVNNYLLALKTDDLEKAYTYLSPTLQGYPANAEEFINDVEDQRWQFHLESEQDHSFQFKILRETDDSASVEVSETVYYQSGLFENSHYTQTFVMRLAKDQNGLWLIRSADDYWHSCWTTAKGCP